MGLAVAPSLVLSFLCHRKVTGRALEPHIRRQVCAYVLPEHLPLPATELVLDGLRSAAAVRLGC